MFGERGQWRAIKDWSRAMESDPLKNCTAVRSERLPIQVYTACELSMVGATDGSIASLVSLCCGVKMACWCGFRVG
jgi:hypothetical protein